MKAFAKQRVGVRYLDPQMTIAQDETLDANAEGSPVARERFHFGRHPATRGEPYLIRRRIEPEGILIFSGRLRAHGGPINEQMQVRIGGRQMAECRCPLR